MLRYRREIIQQPVRAAKPPVPDRRLTPELVIVDAQQRGQTGGGDDVAPPSVQTVCALTRLEHSRRVVQPPSGQAQPLERLSARLARDRCLEAGERLRPFHASQRFQSGAERLLPCACRGGCRHAGRTVPDFRGHSGHCLASRGLGPLAGEDERGPAGEVEQRASCTVTTQELVLAESEGLLPAALLKRVLLAG